MRNEFCTLFDAGYAVRGLALYHSLARVCEEFRLRVFCMDDETKAILDRLALPNLVTVSLAELEAHDRELLAVKPTRGRVDYLLTATPSVCLYTLEQDPNVELITYLDADLMFFRDPAPLFDELGEDSVLITPHRYPPRLKRYEAMSGIYNVQFLPFRRDERGFEVLRWWRERCLEWCYFRYEAGKLGDQKYLDDWPTRFRGVHVLEHLGGGLAPWNAENYDLARANGSVTVDGRPLIFHHYHSLRLYSGLTALRRHGLFASSYNYTAAEVPIVWKTGYSLSDEQRKLLWEPYVRELGRALAEIRRVQPSFARGFEHRSGIKLAGHAVALRAERALERVPRMSSSLTDSWKDAGVARQMTELTSDELEHTEGVPAFGVFLEAIGSMAEELRLPKPARLLDVGCGTGHYSELLERFFPGRFDYTGCDYAPAMIEAARARWPERTFVVNDLFDNKLDLDAFDVLFASALVDVVPDWERALDILLGATAPHVLLHRQRTTGGTSTVRRAAGYPGQKTYRTYINVAQLEAIAVRHGREITRQFPVDDEMQSFVISRTDSLDRA